MLKLIILIYTLTFSLLTFASASSHSSFLCDSEFNNTRITGQLNMKEGKIITENFFLEYVEDKKTLFKTPIYIKYFEFSYSSLQINGIALEQNKISNIYLSVTGNFKQDVARGSMKIGDLNYVIYDTCKFNFTVSTLN